MRIIDGELTVIGSKRGQSARVLDEEGPVVQEVAYQVYTHGKASQDTFREMGVDTTSTFFILEASSKGEGAGMSVDGTNLEVEENLVEA